MKNKYARLLLVFGITTAVFCSCNKDDESDNNGGVISNISANNVSNSSTEIVTVKALVYEYESEQEYVIATAQFQNNGFKLELPSTFSSTYLYLLSDEAPSGVTISDENAKSCELELYGYDDSDNQIGSFYLGNDNDETYEIWVYSDRTVTVKGESTEIDDYYDEEYISKFDVILYKGWNVIYDKESYDYNETSGRDVYTSVFTSNKPSNINNSWYFEGYGAYYSPLQVGNSSIKQKSFVGKLKQGKINSNKQLSAFKL